QCLLTVCPRGACFVHRAATTEIYTLSLHDALPILAHAISSTHPTAPRRTRSPGRRSPCSRSCSVTTATPSSRNRSGRSSARRRRSEEHTSELQSRENLVCRLLLEKKKNTAQIHKQT